MDRASARLVAEDEDVDDDGGRLACCCWWCYKNMLCFAAVDGGLLKYCPKWGWPRDKCLMNSTQCGHWKSGEVVNNLCTSICVTNSQ